MARLGLQLADEVETQTAQIIQAGRLFLVIVQVWGVLFFPLSVMFVSWQFLLTGINELLERVKGHLSTRRKTRKHSSSNLLRRKC